MALHFVRSDGDMVELEEFAFASHGRPSPFIAGREIAVRGAGHSIPRVRRAETAFGWRTSLVLARHRSPVAAGGFLPGVALGLLGHDGTRSRLRPRPLRQRMRDESRGRVKLVGQPHAEIQRRPQRRVP